MSVESLEPTKAKKAIARVRRRRGRERGVALIMVMGTIAVLTVMLAELQDDASTEFASATAGRDAVQAEYMARSAVNLSRLLIAAEPTVRQAVQTSPLGMLFQATQKRKFPQLPIWEYADRLLGAFNDQEGGSDFASSVGIDLSLGKNLGLKGGRFEVRIVDEDSKLNVNAGGNNLRSQGLLGRQLMGLMAPPQYSPLFERKDPFGQFSDRIQICAGIMDWADWDEQGTHASCDLTQTSQGGSQVEDGYYQQLPKPYRRKNAAYDSLEELRLVRGVDDDFWATFIEPDATRPDKRVLTVWGQPKVNVNSANPQTLLALVCAGAPDAEVCMDPNQSAAFLTVITMAKGLTMGAPVFTAEEDFLQAVEGKGMIGPMLQAAGMKPVKWKFRGDAKNSVATESKVFSIYAVGIVKGYKRETRTGLHAVVDFRNAQGLQAMGMPGMGGTTAGTTMGNTAGTTAGTTMGNTMGNTSGGTSGMPTATNMPGGMPDAYPYRPRTDGQVLHFRFE